MNTPPRLFEGHPPNGTDADLPCTRFGNRAGMAACRAYEAGSRNDTVVKGSP